MASVSKKSRRVEGGRKSVPFVAGVPEEISLFFLPLLLPHPPPAVPDTHLAGHYGRDRPTEKMVESESVETFQEDVK